MKNQIKTFGTFLSMLFNILKNSVSLWLRGASAGACGGFPCGSSAQAQWAQLFHGTWRLSAWTKDQTSVPYPGGWILNHWTTRRSLSVLFYVIEIT